MKKNINQKGSKTLFMLHILKCNKPVIINIYIFLVKAKITTTKTTDNTKQRQRTKKFAFGRIHIRATKKV